MERLILRNLEKVNISSFSKRKMQPGFCVWLSSYSPRSEKENGCLPNLKARYGKLRASVADESV